MDCSSLHVLNSLLKDEYDRSFHLPSLYLRKHQIREQMVVVDDTQLVRVDVKLNVLYLNGNQYLNMEIEVVVVLGKHLENISEND
jgi:2-keto-4-pentenoate hydratase/2-oxohepta-3-ene-1,7-dioic acid hydratase in catechol pathway